MLYDEAYAPIYRRLYIEHPMWAAKHRHNLRVIGSLLPPGGSWLDLFCGQAWHFSQVAKRGERLGDMVGVDASEAQLAIARRDNPAARFVAADLRTWDTETRFDLVTAFWSGISYLDDAADIAALVERLAGWVTPNGSAYLEVVTPDSLEAFNHIPFALREGLEVGARSGDYVKWSYSDPAGEHLLTSPPASFYTDILAPHFDSVDAADTITAMRQIVARGRR